MHNFTGMTERKIFFAPLLGTAQLKLVLLLRLLLWFLSEPEKDPETRNQVLKEGSWKWGRFFFRKLCYNIFKTERPLLYREDDSSNYKSRRANNGLSRYPSYQKIFQLAENFQNIYHTLKNWTNFPSISSLCCRIFYEAIQFRLF